MITGIRGITLGPELVDIPNHLHLGDRVFVNRDCYLDLDDNIVIGNDVVIGHRVTIATANHHIDPHHRRAGPLHPQPVHIGDGV